MLRIQIKDDALRFKAVIELIERGFSINRQNKSADCLYIWTDNQKTCDISHWTSDNDITSVTYDNFAWFTSVLTITFD